MYLLLISTFLFCEGVLSAEKTPQNINADITVLNKENFNAFMANKYTFTYFCDFQKKKVSCEEGERMFREAVVILHDEEKFPLKFAKMDIGIETELVKQLGPVGSKTVRFNLYGKCYGTFIGAATELIVGHVYKMKDLADKHPEYFKHPINKLY